jgi:hypothetical protein
MVLADEAWMLEILKFFRSRDKEKSACLRKTLFLGDRWWRGWLRLIDECGEPLQ